MKQEPWMKVGQPCWIFDQNFISGTITQLSPLQCQTQNGIIDAKSIYERDPDQQEYDDLIDLQVLNEAELINQIHSNYQRGIFQLYIGPSLLVVNPVSKQDQLYTKEMKQQYKAMHNAKQLPPHIFSIASQAFKNLDQQKQIIIISGESGAGKTENAKLCMSFLSSIGNLEQKIFKCNPILESFGNAKTSRNNNSSRFGKLIKLHFDDDFKVSGAQIINYLLEKSRITSPNQLERNFHIFYEFLLGAENLQDYFIVQQPDTYEYLKKGGVYFQNNDLENFKQLLDAMNYLNFSSDVIFSLISAILLIGNIDFEELENGCMVKDQQLVYKISQLLGLQEKELMRALTTKTKSYAKNEIIDSPLSRLECINSQQSFARYLYERLFNYIIEQLNVSFQPKQISQNTVSILDIYGFEVFVVNSFEQLFINYTNEKLLQLYIQYVFKEEQNIYQQEGIKINTNQIMFMDNQNIIDCLDKPPLGILNILDDSCAVAGTDETFLSKLKNAYTNSQVVQFPKIANQIFKIRHSAREVEYNVTGFRFKNKDEVNKQLQVLLSRSKNNLIQQIYGKAVKADKFLGNQIRQEMNELMQELKGSNVQFVRCIKPSEPLQQGQFNQALVLNQVRYLGVLETLKIRKEGYSVRKTYPQFYKEFSAMSNLPIPSNVQKKDFRSLVIKIFSTYFAFTQESVLQGNTMVFMKQDTWNAVQQEYEFRMIKKNEMAKKIQRIWFSYKQLLILRGFLSKVRFIQASIKGFLQRIRFRVTIGKILYLQHQIRRFIDKCKFQKYKNATKIIQTYLKRLYSIKYVIVENEAVIKIQRYMRLKITKQRKERYSLIKGIVDQIQRRAWNIVVWRSVIKIQKVWRGHFIRSIYDEQVQQIKLARYIARAEKAITKIQQFAKGYVIRQKYQRLRNATCYIQGYFRTKWLSDLFFRIRYAAIVIQRAMRHHWKKTKLAKLQLLQITKPFEQDFIRQKEMEFNNLNDGYIDNIIENEQENNRKIDLFSCIIDLEMLTDMQEIHDTLWSTIYKKGFKESYEKGNYIQNYCIGEAHTYATTVQGKIFSWGLNDKNQLGCIQDGKPNPNKINVLQVQHKIKTMKSGQNHGLYLTTEGQLFQLGQNYPILKDVKQFAIYNDNNLALDEQGLIYQWTTFGKPQELKSWTQCIKLAQMTQKINVQQISMGLNFFILLTTNGLLFSMGDNFHGELGQNKNQHELTQIDMFDKVVEVHCGMKHVIARSSLGKVFTWGWGARGQLGHGNLKDELYPRQVILDGKSVQVMAGQKSSIIIMETRKVFWWGTNSCLEYQSQPIEFMTAHPPVRVLATWSRSMSVTYITYANTHRLFENNIKLRNRIIGGLTQKWVEQDIFSLEVPYCESLINYFQSMKKPQIKTNIKFASKIEHQQIVKMIQTQQPNVLDQSKSYFSFQEEPQPLQQRDIQRQVEEQQIQTFGNVKMKEMQTNVQKSQDSDQKLKQLRDVKKRYQTILMKNQFEYSQLDREFLQILKDSDLIDILQQIT